MDIMAHNMTTIYGDGEDGGELILADLIKFKRYSIVVQAFNEVGNGPLSEPTTAQTMEDGNIYYFIYVSQLLLLELGSGFLCLYIVLFNADFLTLIKNYAPNETKHVHFEVNMTYILKCFINK